MLFSYADTPVDVESEPWIPAVCILASIFLLAVVVIGSYWFSLVRRRQRKQSRIVSCFISSIVLSQKLLFITSTCHLRASNKHFVNKISEILYAANRCYPILAFL